MFHQRLSLFSSEANWATIGAAHRSILGTVVVSGATLNMAVRNKLQPDQFYSLYISKPLNHKLSTMQQQRCVGLCADMSCLSQGLHNSEKMEEGKSGKHVATRLSISTRTEVHPLAGMGHPSCTKVLAQVVKGTTKPLGSHRRSGGSIHISHGWY